MSKFIKVWQQSKFSNIFKRQKKNGVCGFWSKKYKFGLSWVYSLYPLYLKKKIFLSIFTICKVFIDYFNQKAMNYKGNRWKEIRIYKAIKMDVKHRQFFFELLLLCHKMLPIVKLFFWDHKAFFSYLLHELPLELAITLHGGVWLMMQNKLWKKTKIFCYCNYKLPFATILPGISQPMRAKLLWK